MEKQIKEVIGTSLQKPSPHTENYDDIIIPDDEQKEIIEKALREERKKRFIEKRNREYWDKVNNPVEHKKLTRDETFALFLNQVRQINESFVINDYNKSIISLLCSYFSNDPLFEESGFSLNKGIMLVGPVGCGKTTIMKAFGRNSVNGYAIVACRKVSSDYTHKNEGGHLALNKYSSLLPTYADRNFGQKELGFCFDDLGTEGTKKHFGNEMDVMAEIIYNRYDAGLLSKTHFTANMTSEDIDESYGQRVRSRLREMCNFISFDPKAPDFRK